MNWELPDVQAGFRKGRGTRDQIANIHWIIKKKENSRKKIYFCFTDYAKAFDSVDHKRLENSSRDGNTRPLYLSPEKPICRSRSDSQNQHGTKDWFRLGKQTIKAVCCHPAYLSYMQRASPEMPGWRKHKLEPTFLGEISISSDMQMTPPLWQKVKRT